MPKVSVIIPTYNRANYLPDAINSVLSQTYKDYELIIIDDGSNDDTRAVVDTYGSKVKYFYKRNGGDASARNEGIRKAKGEYVAFLDSDDIWFPIKLECQVKAMKKNNVSFVHTGRWEIDLQGKVDPFMGPKMPAKSSREFLTGKTHISMTVMAKREALISVGMFDESLSSVSDTDLWLRMTLKYELAYVDEPLMTVRMHNDNLSRKMERKYADRCIVAQRMFQRDDARIPKSNWRRKIAENYYFLGIEKYKKQYYGESFAMIMHALAMNPFIGRSNMYPQDRLMMKIKKFFAPVYFLVVGSTKRICSGVARS